MVGIFEDICIYKGNKFIFFYHSRKKDHSGLLGEGPKYVRGSPMVGKGSLPLLMLHRN